SLLAKPRDSTPIRIYVRAEKLPDETEVARFLWPLGRGARPFIAKSAGSNLFLIFRAFPKNVNAEDYLAWSKSLESDFDAVRNALRRPLARLDGDHSVPFRGVKLDFVTIRMLAQVLSQRAQCHL